MFRRAVLPISGSSSKACNETESNMKDLSKVFFLAKKAPSIKGRCKIGSELLFFMQPVPVLQRCFLHTRARADRR